MNAVAADRNLSANLGMDQYDDFSTLFELLPIGAYRMTPAGEMLRANLALVRMIGAVDEVELRAFSWGNWYVMPGRRAEFVERIQNDGMVQGFVSEVVEKRTGVHRWISENARIVRDVDGKALYYEGTAEDITQLKESEKNLHFVLQHFYALTSKSQSAAVICDAAGKIRYASDVVRTLFGIAPESMIGANLFDTIHPEDKAGYRAEFQRVVQSTNANEESVVRHRHADGSWRYLASFVHDARDDESIQGLIVHWHDVTEAHLAHMRLRPIVENDGLTGLYARTHFEHCAHIEIDALKRRAGQAALFFIDLDNFKLANDSYGHSVHCALLKWRVVGSTGWRRICSFHTDPRWHEYCNTNGAANR
jgi:PAS domain S-box-containing protein